MSDRVTIPRIVPLVRTRTAGFDFDNSFTTLSTGWSPEIIGNGDSITSLTVESSSLGFSRLFCDSDQSLTEPTQFWSSITGNCDMSWSAISPSACHRGPWSSSDNCRCLALLAAENLEQRNARGIEHL